MGAAAGAVAIVAAAVAATVAGEVATAGGAATVAPDPEPELSVPEEGALHNQNDQAMAKKKGEK